jgi:hypothetical protein
MGSPPPLVAGLAGTGRKRGARAGGRGQQNDLRLKDSPLKPKSLMSPRRRIGCQIGSQPASVSPRRITGRKGECHPPSCAALALPGGRGGGGGGGGDNMAANPKGLVGGCNGARASGGRRSDASTGTG